MSLGISCAYALYNLLLGLGTLSIWFLIMSLYYLSLCLMKFYAFYKRTKSPKENNDQYKTIRNVGIMLFPFVIVLILTIFLSLKYDLVNSHSKIIMITIAAYTTYKIIAAIVNLKKAKKKQDSNLIAVRNINLVEAIVSVLNLQISMYASFGATESSHTLNVIGGFAACALILFVAIRMLIIAHKRKQISEK